MLQWEEDRTYTKEIPLDIKLVAAGDGIWDADKGDVFPIESAFIEFWASNESKGEINKYPSLMLNLRGSTDKTPYTDEGIVKQLNKEIKAHPVLSQFLEGDFDWTEYGMQGETHFYFEGSSKEQVDLETLTEIGFEVG